jgi:hypothetical protein
MVRESNHHQNALNLPSSPEQIKPSRRSSMGTVELVTRKAISHQNLGTSLRTRIDVHPIGKAIFLQTQHIPLQVDQNIIANTVTKMATQKIVAKRRNMITNPEKKEKLNKCYVSKNSIYS